MAEAVRDNIIKKICDLKLRNPEEGVESGTVNFTHRVSLIASFDTAYRQSMQRWVNVAEVNNCTSTRSRSISLSTPFTSLSRNFSSKFPGSSRNGSSMRTSMVTRKTSLGDRSCNLNPVAQPSAHAPDSQEPQQDLRSVPATGSIATMNSCPETTLIPKRSLSFPINPDGWGASTDV